MKLSLEQAVEVSKEFKRLGFIAKLNTKYPKIPRKGSSGFKQYVIDVTEAEAEAQAVIDNFLVGVK
jgi:hypothetical protein